MKIQFSFIQKTVKRHNLHADCKEAIKGLMSPEGATIYIFHEGFSPSAAQFSDTETLNVYVKITESDRRVRFRMRKPKFN